MSSMKRDQEIFSSENDNLCTINKNLEQIIVMKIDNEKKLLEDNQVLDKLIQNLQEQLTTCTADQKQLNELNDPEVVDSHLNAHKCSSCEYFKHQLNAYIYLYGELNQSNVQDIPEQYLNEDTTQTIKKNITKQKCMKQDDIYNVVNDQRMDRIPLNENLIKSHSDYSLSDNLSSNESTSTNECKDASDTKPHNVESTKQNESVIESTLSNQSTASEYSQSNNLNADDIRLKWSKINEENTELKHQLKEINGFWVKRQRKLEDYCHQLLIRLKYMKSKYHSSSCKSSWIKSSLNILIPSRRKYNTKHKWKLNPRKLHLNFNNSYNYNQNNIDNQIITSNHNNDDHESNVTCSKLKKWKYSNNTPKLKLINDYRTSLIKSRKHAIQLLNTQNKLPYLSEIQCSYELLNQRNNSLLQQYQVMRKLKIQKEQSNHELNNLVESLSSILHRSRKQNIQSKRIIENLKTYLYKLCHTINQFISANDQVTNVHYDNKLPSENINSKLTKEKTNETLKLTEIHLQQTIKTQRCQLQILINEKKQLTENFTQLKQAHHYLVNELNELKLTLMNFNKSKHKNSMKNLDNDVKQTKIVNRICY
ncbi:hypothetical protein EWB00_008765, partial [Schistosoma japonicum]